jgi:hypothetical protein
MKFIRCTTIAVVEYIKPYLMMPPILSSISKLEDEEYREQTADQLKQMIETWDKNFYFIDVCIADDEVLGFIIAHVNNAMVPVVYLSQFWAKTFDKQHLVSEGLFKRLINWTDNLGIQFITCETPRNPEAVARRYGFEPKSTTMVLDLTKREDNSEDLKQERNS